MYQRSLEIRGYKSIVNLRLKDLNPFTVFVGANASGKSNIFEALEFLNFCSFMDPDEAVKYFGGMKDVIPLNPAGNPNLTIEFLLDLGDITPNLTLFYGRNSDRTFAPIHHRHFDVYITRENQVAEDGLSYGYSQRTDYKQLINFTRLFVGNSKLVKRNLLDDSRLNIDASNLEKVLKRIFKNKNHKDEIIEILQALIPGFDSVDIRTETLSGNDNLLVWEKGMRIPFTKRLISDGTFNLIAIIASLFQSDSPQFICIEEPENGINPKVARELVEIFRNFCNDHGHCIWLNTHSQSIVSGLTPDEIILIDKKEGQTVAKQIKGMELHGLRMDEALLSNALDGGIPF